VRGYETSLDGVCNIYTAERKRDPYEVLSRLPIIFASRVPPYQAASLATALLPRGDVKIRSQRDRVYLEINNADIATISLGVLATKSDA